MIGFKFKIGDQVKIKKFSKKEFESVYIIRIFNYKRYLEIYRNYFNKIFTIESCNSARYTLHSHKNYQRHIFYSEELEKVDLLKNKIAKMRKLLN